MKDEPTRPLSVWITQGLLLLSTVFFTVLMGISFAYETTKPAQFLYAALLVVLPVIALTGLFSRSAWGRRAATLSLLCMWAFQLRTLWVFGTASGIPFETFLRFSYLTAFMLMLASFAIGIPLLLFKLYRGESESTFFNRSDPETKGLSAGNPLYIGDAVADLDQSFFDRQADLLFK
ncbi:MAG TPA: hypothetical protein VHQ01_02710 [Pyrinomonadaceae bacterium]|nr:hypothetical protein [Pyrinomonadaceae bacterium]